MALRQKSFLVFLFILWLGNLNAQAQNSKSQVQKNTVKKNTLTRPVAREPYITIEEGQGAKLKSYKMYSDLKDPNKNLLMYTVASLAPQKIKLSRDQVLKIENLTFKVWDQLPKKKSKKKCAPYIQLKYLMGEKPVCVDNKKAVKDSGPLLDYIRGLVSKTNTKG